MGRIQFKVVPTDFKEAELKKLLPETLVLIGENEVIYSSLQQANVQRKVYNKELALGTTQILYIVFDIYALILGFMQKY